MRFTLMLLADSNGRKKEPFIVMKNPISKVPETLQENVAIRHGFGKHLFKEVQQLMIKHRCQIYSNENGWFTSNILCKWLRFYFWFNTTPKLLLLDDFGAHKTEEVMQTAASLHVHIFLIPPGLTAVCQPADISWLKPLKASIRLCWTRQVMETLSGTQLVELKQPSRDNVVGWICECWNYLSVETIKSGFKDYVEGIAVVQAKKKSTLHYYA